MQKSIIFSYHYICLKALNAQAVKVSFYAYSLRGISFYIKSKNLGRKEFSESLFQWGFLPD